MNKLKLKIRKLVSKDKEAFLAMSREFYSSDAVLHDIKCEYYLKTFEELMRSDEYLECYIFESDGNTIGYALLNRTFCREAGGIVVWIEELYIRPRYQGRGFGTFFFRWLEENIPAARYRLEVEPNNTRAMVIYSRIGYQNLPYIQMIKE